MTVAVEIPGGTAYLREPHEVRVKHRRLIEAAALAASGALAKIPSDVAARAQESDGRVEVAGLDLTQHEATTMLELQDATIVAMLESWTLTDANGLPLPLPTLDTVGDMDPAVYDALAKATRDAGAQVVKATDLSVNPDPKAPTTLSSVSNGSSEAVEATEPTPFPAT